MNLREIRVKNKIKASELAAKMAVDVSTFVRWENGTRSPDVDSLLELSHILNCSLDDLVNPIPSPIPTGGAGTESNDAA